jgi:hypothetical protein
MWPVFEACWANPRSAYLAESALCGLFYRPARLVQGVLTWHYWPYVVCFIGLPANSKKYLLVESALCGLPSGLVQGVLTWQNWPYVACVIGRRLG